VTAVDHIQQAHVLCLRVPFAPSMMPHVDRVDVGIEALPQQLLCAASIERVAMCNTCRGDGFFFPSCRLVSSLECGENSNPYSTVGNLPNLRTGNKSTKKIEKGARQAIHFERVDKKDLLVAALRSRPFQRERAPRARQSES